MAISTNKYRHKIKLIYNQDGKILEFNKDSITNLIINYDYDKFNMPMMYLKISLEKSLIDYMIKNKNNKYMGIYIDKFIYDDPLQISTNCIKDQFIYFMDENLNDIDKLDYNDDNTLSTNQRVVTIGLMKLQNIDDNKKTISGIYNNTSLLEIILSQLTHMKLLMEPLPKDKEVNKFFIPVYNSVIKFLDYLDKQYSIYNKNYRFFIDYDKTYLLSNSGNPVPSIDETYNRIIFDVTDISSPNTRIEGMSIDDNAQSYLIHITNSDISMFQNKSVVKSTNTIIGVNEEGKKNTSSINNNSTIDTKQKVKFVKTSNLNYVNNIKDNIESSSIIVNIIKSEIDSSIITMNKEYLIRNHPDTRINGKYLLSSKKEIYTRKDDGFIISCIFSLRKIS